MSGALNSVFGGGGILGAALNMASIAFPPLGIATSLANMVTQGVGQAVNQAVQQLTQQSGMPKFLGGLIGDIVKEALKDLSPQSQPQCDQAAQDNFGGDVRSLMDDLTKSIFEGAQSIMDNCKGEKGGKAAGKGGAKASAGSWLEAIALAMGEAAGNKAAKMVELSNKLKELSSAGGDEKAQQQSAKEMNAVNAQFQAASQEFNMLQSAFSNAIKSIGEGMAQMARKG
jgi:hypothetical protein